jgi:superfamily I DNA and/or RNA helicase
MSPLAVAQYLPRGGMMFDLSIIDEASQMPPEDSVGALVRAHQTMVVGDTNQLPPTSFFRKMIEDDDLDEDETVLDESVLEMANASFRPARRLRWHYRSQHSGLIRFSNDMVYDNDLVIFPSATEAMPGKGVSLRKVDGLYHSRTNMVEAKAIIDAAVDLMTKEPHRSLGIVTLNQTQQALIQEEWEYILSTNRAAAEYVEYWERKERRS